MQFRESRRVIKPLALRPREAQEPLSTDAESIRARVDERNEALKMRVAKEQHTRVERNNIRKYELSKRRRSVGNVALESTEEAQTTGISPDEANDLLGYGDVDFTPEEAQLVADSEQDPEKSAQKRKYVDALINMAEQYGKDAVLQTAENIRNACFEELDRLGLQPSKFGRSITWALWDMAKQRRLFEYPTESHPDYELGNPMADDEWGAKIRQVIADRHVGWEYDAATGFGNAIDAVAPLGPESANRIILSGQRNDTNQLRSLEYSRLGATLRKS